MADEAGALVPVAQKVLWTLRDLRALTGLCRATIERLVARGEMPAPTKIGKRNVWQPAAVRAAFDAITGTRTCASCRALLGPNPDCPACGHDNPRRRG